MSYIKLPFPCIHQSNDPRTCKRCIKNTKAKILAETIKPTKKHKYPAWMEEML